MTFTSVQHIWNPETGILPLPEVWESLHVADFDAVRAEWQMLRARIGEGPQLQEILNQLYREWAIETGAIENLYDIERGVTESLIVKGISTDLMEHGSVDRDPVYIKNLIDDQQAALDGLFDFIKSDRPLSTSYIKELHSMMTRSQGEVEARTLEGDLVTVPLLRGSWKVHPNYPVRNGVSYHYCPPEQVDSEMERLVSMYLDFTKSEISADVVAAWLHHRFTQIHPFQDGNGRIARAIATLVLVKAGVEPLVITRIDRASYITALELADGGNLRPLCLTIARRTRAQYVKTSQKVGEIMATILPAEHPADRVKQILMAKRPPKSPERDNRRWAFTRKEDLMREFASQMKSHIDEFEEQNLQVIITYDEAIRADFALFSEVESTFSGQDLDQQMAYVIHLAVGEEKFRILIDPICVNPDIERLLIFQFEFYWTEKMISRCWSQIHDSDQSFEEVRNLARETDTWVWDCIAQALSPQADPIG